MTIEMNDRPVAVITGASSGFGRIFAERLAQEGNDLIIIARHEDKLNSVATELRAKHRINVEIIVADLANLDDVKRVENRIKELPTLKYMINNAGFGGNQQFPVNDVTIETRMIQTHCIATMRLSQAALLIMKAKGLQKGAGYIINVASIAGFLAGAGAADYCGTKAYIISFSKCLQCDARKYGVRVQALCPGFAHTGFHDSETMVNSHIKEAYPEFFWGKAEDVVDHSLVALRTPFRNSVVYIPKVFYKLVGYFGSSWLFAPLRVLFSGGALR